jgi:hypothetical protein
MGPVQKNTAPYPPMAFNLNGKPLWYYPGITTVPASGSYYIRPIDGGTMMLHMNDPTSPWVVNQFWREIDLAGNTLRQTTVARVNQQINPKGYVGCTSFSHDAIRLPNGHTLIICTQEKIYPSGTQGATKPVDILGNGIVDLDTNLQLAWYWSGYDHLDVNRKSSLNETLSAGNGYAPVVLANISNDWLHCNSLNYIPATGDILLSARNQDWVIKINYKNGTGDGSILWRLGVDGDFTINSSDFYPWFTHQHDAEYELGGNTLLSVFDNGNLRVMQNPGTVQNSRGMALNIDETNMVATPVLSVDLGDWASAGGSAQLLDNGNYHFDKAVLGPLASRYSQHPEIAPTSGTTTGTINYELQDSTFSYRSYRMSSLYSLK